MKVLHKLTILLIVPFAAGCRAATSQPASSFSILWAGDTLLDDAAQPYLDQHGYLWPLEHLAPLIDGDYAIANAEGPITTRQQPWDPGQRWSYNAQPQAAQALAGVGFDAVGLSNNHAMDRGPQGIADTRAHLQANGLRPFGAGANLAQAEAPLLIETPFGAVGVVALSLNWGEDRTAGEDQPGTVALSEASIERGYRLARSAGADWVVAFVHWGHNYAEVDENQRRRAEEFSRAGYDLVIGHGPHVVQPIDLEQGMPVVYSLGNFAFGTEGRFSEDYPGFGLVVASQLGPGGFDALVIRCIQTDNQQVAFQPRPCTPSQAQEVLGGLHPNLVIRDGVGVLSW